ncbi:extracellular solute-binding protein [Jatrophihabitans sp. GAS493]|uniref:extracellular solute-binding protein n=1 Tax=Jatrophihabitans sp. GAS493 TaxID=1907575 RepID=UPI000BB8D8EA|nr:extracellular solute-binding protein [Jatrophihabitans sp. GAS493]
MTGTRFRSYRKLTTLVASAAIVALGATACSSSSATNSSGSTELKLVAYSVPKPAYDALQAAFGKTPAGKGVTWKTSYGASGTQSKNVSAGTVKADYVAFSVTPDLTKLVPKFVDAGWDSGETKGLVSDSVVVISVRKGNPLHITGWDDLIKPGVKIVTPDPASSGSAKWNILAAYSHVEAAGGTEAQAKDYLTKFFGNVVSRASSGAVATTQFLGGTGDVLISYENEAIASRQAGKSLDYIVPDETMLIENPAAVTKTAPTQAKDFLTFLLSTDGQKIFASKGFRPVVTGTPVGTVEGANDPANPYPTPKHLVTIADLGGWTAVNAKFFGTDGLVTQIEKTG